MGKHLAIIPARSGSKGLKDKNIKKLAGKPLLSYSVEAALKSGIFDCVHLSTDSSKYALIGQQYGADVPFLRSKKMSSDKAGSWDVVIEVLNNYEKIKCRFDMITLLQPTSPLRTAEDIKNAFRIYMLKDAKAVVSVCEMAHSPLWCNTLPEDCSMEFFNRKEGEMSRQMLPVYYQMNGAIYMVDTNFLLKDTNIYRKGCFAYIMDKNKSVDIDTELDFMLAEFLIKKYSKT